MRFIPAQHTRTHTHTHAHTRTHTHTHIHAHAHTHAHTRIHTHTRAASRPLTFDFLSDAKDVNQPWSSVTRCTYHSAITAPSGVCYNALYCVLQVSIPDTALHELQPCQKDLLVYIEARYRCVTGEYSHTHAHTRTRSCTQGHVCITQRRMCDTCGCSYVVHSCTQRTRSSTHSLTFSITPTHPHTHTHTHAHTLTHTPTPLHTHTHRHIHSHTHSHTHAHKHKRSYCLQHTHTQIYTHTHTHTHSIRLQTACVTVYFQCTHVYVHRCARVLLIRKSPTPGQP